MIVSSFLFIPFSHYVSRTAPLFSVLTSNVAFSSSVLRFLTGSPHLVLWAFLTQVWIVPTHSSCTPLGFTRSSFVGAHHRFRVLVGPRYSTAPHVLPRLATDPAYHPLFRLPLRAGFQSFCVHCFPGLFCLPGSVVHPTLFSTVASAPAKPTGGGLFPLSFSIVLAVVFWDLAVWEEHPADWVACGPCTYLPELSTTSWHVPICRAQSTGAAEPIEHQLLQQADWQQRRRSSTQKPGAATRETLSLVLSLPCRPARDRDTENHQKERTYDGTTTDYAHSKPSNSHADTSLATQQRRPRRELATNGSPQKTSHAAHHTAPTRRPDHARQAEAHTRDNRRQHWQRTTDERIAHQGRAQATTRTIQSQTTD